MELIKESACVSYHKSYNKIHTVHTICTNLELQQKVPIDHESGDAGYLRSRGYRFRKATVFFNLQKYQKQDEMSTSTRHSDRVRTSHGAKYLGQGCVSNGTHLLANIARFYNNSSCSDVQVNLWVSQ